MKNQDQEPKIGRELAKFWEELLEEQYDPGDYPYGFEPGLYDL